jgi:hypothetical protein
MDVFSRSRPALKPCWGARPPFRPWLHGCLSQSTRDSQTLHASGRSPAARKTGTPDPAAIVVTLSWPEVRPGRQGLLYPLQKAPPGSAGEPFWPSNPLRAGLMRNWPLGPRPGSRIRPACRWPRPCGNREVSARKRTTGCPANLTRVISPRHAAVQVPAPRQPTEPAPARYHPGSPCRPA